MAEVNDRLIIEFEAKLDKLVAGVAAGNREVRNFARQAEKDLTDLQLKLEIAQARGDKAAAQGLRDQIQLQQTKQRLLRSGIELTEAQAKAEAHLAEVVAARHKAEAGGVGVALGDVFDSSKLAVIEEGSAKLRVFGSAIEPLGAFGIGAAIGVVALVAAIEQVKKAGEEVGQIAIRAERLGVGVEALQALDFAAKESHVSTEQLDESLSGLNESLGKLRQGVGDKRLLPEAALLGLKPDDIAKYKDAAEFLPDLIERISALPSLGEKVNAASKFGIEPLLPLILKGKEGVKELEEEFRALGITVSDRTAQGIEKGNLALERADTIAHDKIRNSLLDLHPLLVSVGTWWDDMAARAVDAGSKTLAAFAVAARFAGGERFGSGGRDTGRFYNPFAGAAGSSGPGAGEKPVAAPAGPTPAQIAAQVAAGKELETLQASLLDHTTHRLEAERKIADIEAKQGHAIDAQLKARLLAAADKEDSAPGQRASDAAARKAEEARKKAEEQAKASADVVFAADEALIAAKRGDLQAQLALTHDAGQREALQGQIKALDAEHAKVLLDRKNADLQARANLGQITQDAAKAAIASNNRAKTETDLTQSAQDRLTADQALAAKAQDALRLSELDLQGEVQRLQLQEAMATTREQRAELERRILDLTHQEEEAKLKAVLAAPDSVTSPAQKAEAQKGLENLTALYPLQKAQLAQNSGGPLDQYLRGIQDLDTEFEQDGVTAIKSLSSGLVDAALHAQSLGGVLKNVFLNLLQQILTQSLEKEAAPGLASGFSALLSLIPGHAAGTNSSPGGLHWIGEDGPELMDVPKGAKIIPNSAIRAASSGGVRASGGGVYAPVYNDLRGSIVQEALYDRINRGDAAAAARGAQHGRTMAVQDIKAAGYIAGVNQ